MGHRVTQTQINKWLIKDNNPLYQELTDTELAIFLNGLIIDKRGKKEGTQPEIEKHLTNNVIFKKLRIALNLKAEDILNIMNLVDLHMSKHELSALFRREDNKHYRNCKDKILYDFLNGMQRKYRLNI
jgi:uncharacterized protein YehS (DUF1456 family)